MGDKPWKVLERKVAAFFGGKRCAVADRATRGDVTHNTLYIEVKKRKKHSVITLWDDTKSKAGVEGKTPVVCLSENGRPGFWILVHSDDLVKL